VLFRVVYHEPLHQMLPTMLNLEVAVPRSWSRRSENFLYLVGYLWAVKMDLLPRTPGRLRGGLCHVCEFLYAYFSLLTCVTLAA
jgi:hypothetical protein